MWHRIDLKLRIYVPLAIIMALTLCGALITMWYTFRIDALFADVLQRHIAAYHSATALETALVNQKGYVSYYFQDGDPAWLEQLETYRRVFRTRLAEAQDRADTPELAASVMEIDREYRTYIAEKNTVIGLYRAGDMARGQALHQTVRNRFFHLLELCERFRTLNDERVVAAQQRVHERIRQLQLACVAGIFSMGAIGIMLALVIGHQVLRPLTRLDDITRKGQARANGSDSDMVQRLSQSVEGLIAHADQKETELEKSRESLLQAEKLAMVGKLAAGVAHSVRNPLTSVKMRLFSLDRSLSLSPDQKEDFDVISEEIRHVDAIVGNFLEFARPPKLNVQRISPSTVVDQAVQLLTHRLASYDVTVTVKRHQALADVAADPEQLKEVMVNIIVNACEAMTGGGAVTITETMRSGGTTPVIDIAFADTGPGIPEPVLQRIFEPFFTTKDEGTGLGLSIVERIVREHGGHVSVTSAPDQGTTFTLSLPGAQ